MVKLINNSKLPVYNILVPHWVEEYGALGCTKVDVLSGMEVEIVLPLAPQIDPISWINYYAGLEYIGITAEGLDSIGGKGSGKVIISFKDEEGNAVLTPKTFTGEIDTQFDIKEADLGITEPYEFVDVADGGSLQGTYTKEDIKLTVNVNNTAPKPIKVESVTMNPATLSLEEGATGNVTGTVVPANADNKKVTYASSVQATATVDATGKVTAIAEGTSNITATSEDGNKVGTCVLTVTAKEVEPEPEE